MTEYIEREAAIDAVDAGNLHRGIVDALQSVIAEIPAADVKPVAKGKWINAYIQGVHHYRCTNCGEYIEAIWTANFDYNFCPNCGADMRRANNG